MKGRSSCYLVVTLTLWFGGLGLPTWAGQSATAPYPADGDSGVVAPIFMWEGAPTAVIQRLYLSQTPDSLALVAELEADETFYYYVDGFLPGYTYYWRVDTQDAAGVITSGTLWSFSTWALVADMPEPAHAALYVPVNLILSWLPGFTAYSQDLYLGTDANAVLQADSTWPEYQGRLSGEVEMATFTDLDPNTVYYWRVDSWELDGSLYTGPLWSFTTWPVIEVKDPSLIAWWRFDEGIGDYALDWSGHERHGECESCQWVQLPTGGTMAFDGSASQMTARGEGLPVGDDRFSLAFWFCPETTDRDQCLLGWGQEATGQCNRLDLYGATLTHRLGDQVESVILDVVAGEWTHVLITHWGGGLKHVYINGVSQERSSMVQETLAIESGPFWLGKDFGSTQLLPFAGEVDDLRIYDRLSTADEIPSMLKRDKAVAWRPKPARGAIMPYGQTDTLAWEGSAEAIGYHVYLGTDRAALKAGRVKLEFYLGMLTEPMYALPETLEAGRTYYWRVDQILPDMPTWRGDLWQFQVASYESLDDFESYNGTYPNHVYMSWLDGLGYDTPAPGMKGNGSGAMVGYLEPPYIEPMVIHGGQQSAPILYKNQQAPFYSEVDHFFATPQDWSGMDRLMLYVSGQADNQLVSGEQVYVKLHDSDGRTVTILHEDPTSLVTAEHWFDWEVSLDSLVGQVDCQHITQLTLGIGSENPSKSGGYGVLYLDDLRLRLRP